MRHNVWTIFSYLGSQDFLNKGQNITHIDELVIRVDELFPKSSDIHQ